MAAYADYTFYTETYCGSAVPEKDWPYASRRASALIDQMTGGRISYLESVPDAIKNACCAVADQLWQDEQQGDKASETVGSHSVSYQNRDASQKKKRYYDAAKLYLMNSGLLYKGGC